MRGRFAITGLAAIAAACGGEGGGGSPAADPNQPPTAVARVVGESVANATTAFDTSGSADRDGSIVSRQWDYGDGQTGASDSHLYAAPGNFTATYTVTDDRGARSSVSVTVTVRKCSAAGTQAAALSPHTALCMQTNRGEMVLEVYPMSAPITTTNFLRYVDDGFYGGVLFHRVVPGFVIQGGGFVAGPVAKATTHPPIVLESNNGLKNWAYTLAMARNNAPDSATSQFFVNLVDNPGLDYSPAVSGPNGYAVFGQVIAGRAVVDAIAAEPTRSVVGLQNVPVQDVVIRSIVRLP